MSLLSESNRGHLRISVRWVIVTLAVFIATYKAADSCSYNQNVECHLECVCLSEFWCGQFGEKDGCHLDK